MKKILDYLEQLGLTKIEAKLYLQLLSHGPMTVQELAKKAQINRTAAYTPVNTLLEKGIFKLHAKNSLKRLIALPPDRLHYLIDNKQEEINYLDRNFSAMINSINQTLNRNPREEKVDVAYYKGKKGLDEIYDEAMKTNCLRVYANLDEMIKIFDPHDFNIFEKALARNKKLKIYEIIGDNPESIKKYDVTGTAKKGRYYYKLFPANIGLTAATFIYDNKVAILNVKSEISGVVLHNSDYYNNSLKLFDFMWKILPEPNKL